jgi:hypothetical protein
MFIRLLSYSHFNISLIQPYSFVSSSLAGHSIERQREAFRAWLHELDFSSVLVIFRSLGMVSWLIVWGTRLANAFHTFRNWSIAICTKLHKMAM